MISKIRLRNGFDVFVHSCERISVLFLTAYKCLQMQAIMCLAGQKDLLGLFTTNQFTSNQIGETNQ